MINFDDITCDGRLWAVRYEGENENALFHCLDQWNDVEWLRDFFLKNKVAPKDIEGGAEKFKNIKMLYNIF